jgi:HEAT repeat protein
MKNRSLLHLLPVALLTFSQVVGTAGVVRSQTATQQQGQTAALDRLIQKVKTANQGELYFISEELRKQGQPAISALIPLLKDPSSMVRSQAAEALGRIGKTAEASIPELLALFRECL